MFVLASAALRLPAQSVNASDTAWAAVKHLGRPKGAVANPAAELLADAERLRDFQAKHPAHPEAKNAKCLEGLALVRAWLEDLYEGIERDIACGKLRPYESKDVWIP